ncbi:lipase family protein [Nocardia sp. NPDC050712]|uniref:lipase family protein n=1 Tax=Nocardia sp. NPDC050712 TaxID=3155518 RepID=UPI0033D38FAC
MRTRMMTVAAGVVLALAVAPAPVTAAEATAPGLVTEVADAPERVRPAGAAVAQRLTYWSRGPRGPMQSTAMVYLPPGPPPPGGWPVVAYAHGSVGIADQCAFTLSPRDYYLNEVYPALLGAGYAVVISDYVGLGTPGTHPYLDGPSQARSVIDGVRAARGVAPGLSTRWAVLGQSQGGQTALFAAHLAPADAPELQLRGAAATGPPSNLELVAPLLGPWVPRLPLRITTAYFAMIVAGLRATAPELDVDSYLTPVGQAVLEVVENTCVNEADEQVRTVAIGDMLTKPLLDPRLLAAVSAMLRIPVQGHTRPLFIGQGLADLEVPAPLSAKLVAELRLAGADLEVGVYPGGHLDAARQAFPDALAFLHRVLDRP